VQPQGRRALSSSPDAPAARPDGLLGPADVRDLAGRLGVRPTKSLGQNFVVDPGTVRRIAARSGVGPDDVVVEVGPGLGSLTLALLATGALGTASAGERSSYKPSYKSYAAPQLNVGIQKQHADSFAITGRGPASALAANNGDLEQSNSRFFGPRRGAQINVGVQNQTATGVAITGKGPASATAANEGFLSQSNSRFGGKGPQVNIATQVQQATAVAVSGKGPATATAANQGTLLQNNVR
jgi:hypothetical protein